MSNSISGSSSFECVLEESETSAGGLKAYCPQAENTLFKVPTYAFPADEGIFAYMFALPKGDKEPEGSSDDNPINLPPEVSASDFKSLLKACLPQSVEVIAHFRSYSNTE